MKLLRLCLYQHQRFAAAAAAFVVFAPSFFGSSIAALYSDYARFDTAYYAEYGIASSTYQDHFDEWVGKGYRLVFVTGYASGSNRYFNTIWHQNDDGLQWSSQAGLTEDEYQDNFVENTSDGFVPVFIDGYSDVDGDPRINVIYHKDTAGARIINVGQSSEEYQSTFDDMDKYKYHLDVVSSYEQRGEERLASLFSQYTDEPDQEYAWEARHGMTEGSYQDAFDDLVEIRGYTLNYVSAGTIDGDEPRFAALFVKANGNEMVSSSFLAYHGVSTSDVQAIFERDTSLGYIPKVIDAYQLEDEELRWVLLFDRRDTVPNTEPNGPTFAQTQCFDQVVTTFMDVNEIPGVGIAVMKDGKIVYAQGYGVKDSQHNKAFMHTPFRLASISKSVTSLAIMRLVQSADLELGDKVFGDTGILEAFSDSPDPCCPIVDDRLFDVTIEHLLTHRGGWNSELSFDPMFESKMISSALGIDGPATCEDTIYYMFGRYLDFTPGTDYAYSNFGFCILGRVIEQVTGQTYEEAVRDLFLNPSGVKPEEMYLGSTRLHDIPEFEAEYFCPDCDLVDSVFPSDENKARSPYGGWSLEAMDSHGGWVASAVQLMNMLAVVHPPHCNNAESGSGVLVDCLLSQESFDDIVDEPGMDGEEVDTEWYGMGFGVQRENGGFNLSHEGRLDGTRTEFVLTNYGYAWAFLANIRDIDGSIYDLMWEAVGCVEDNGGDWPADFKVTGASAFQA
jgi:CubicO group peptidase (beta-lactamase class C family)